tara:strand:- start:381 stop:593 length:213 start_codon:yes stop_codon:yes gene_type:complete
MRELNKEEIESLGIIWNKIKSGTAQNIRDKEEAVLFWNQIAGTKYKKTTSCGSCLSTVYHGLKNLYNELY